ncbi:hypothetical protein LMANV2_600012 [Leptospira interrogans serovar Manilae]|uniref:Uncharacterized protein n=1 Tax=Leptospira interrogans serovar Manilae TaxID=214675 RepID=A0AAQ1P3D8_LEPIR|nr:hypothetical protein LMANV2_600012 [Leptospira interrogans serovar Manilae]
MRSNICGVGYTYLIKKKQKKINFSAILMSKIQSNTIQLCRIFFKIL